jgi:nucleoside-diphosphate-sugar epimerase
LKKDGLKGKRILVTGASGFIGRHLTTELQKQGAKVLALDVQDNNPVDLRDWHRLEDFGNELGKLDLAYHLAGLMFVPYSFENPREIYEVNVLGTLNLLELCRLHKAEKVVFASSYVYGPPQYLPIDEEHPLNPTSPYARSKVMGENLLKAFHEDYGLKYTILRPFNIYGEGQSDNFLIPTILKQMACGKIELVDPEPKRDFLYINDMVDAYLKVGENDSGDLEIFNIGAGSSYSVDEIVQILMGIWGKQVDVSYKHSRRRNEIMNVVADVQKAKKELGWTPRVELKEGLKKYIQWYKARLNSAFS